MIHVALVEDDRNYAESLTEHLRHYEADSGEKIKITVFEDGEDIATDYKAEYDIILMDIEMRFMDGMTAAEKIREHDSEVVIIFITNMPQYAIKGYLVDALDYVLKPVSYFAFSQRIDRALVRMKKRDRKYLTIAVKGGMQKIDISQIYYVEVQDHDLIYYTAAGKFEGHDERGRRCGSQQYIFPVQPLLSRQSGTCGEFPERHSDRGRSPRAGQPFQKESVSGCAQRLHERGGKIR